MEQELTVVVTGSTGKQGGAVARGLLERGHKIRAVTRDPNSSQAKSLAKAGATLVAASLEDTAAITKVLEGATSLFAMTTPFGSTALETRQGVVAADAAKVTGVHLVFTSVGSANRYTGIPHFDSKYEVEKHISEIGVRATILAPVAFMENLYFIKEQLAKGEAQKRKSGCGIKETYSLSLRIRDLGRTRPSWRRSLERSLVDEIPTRDPGARSCAAAAAHRRGLRGNAASRRKCWEQLK